MSENGKTRQRAAHFNDIVPADPAVRRFGEWPAENRGFFMQFRKWLRETGYSETSLSLYSVAARQAIGFLDRPYWKIDPDADLQQAWEHLCQRPLTANTLSDYHKGILKLAEYLRRRGRIAAKPPQINWAHYIGPLPAWLQADLQEFLDHCRNRWQPDRRQERFNDTLSRISQSLRWMAARYPFEDLRSLTPQAWYAYLDARLQAGISTSTVNNELAGLKHFVHYFQERERPVCERFLQVDYLDEELDLPRDVPVEQLRRLQAEIEKQAACQHAGWRRIGRMDLAWFLLMLHCGLRTCEVRSLRLADIDWETRRVRIEQAKNMKDRFIFLSPACLQALQAYLEMRGQPDALPDFVFIFRHRPLTSSYCYTRLRTYGERLGLQVHPHQLRHSHATLLLNAGAPILTVQTLLGHKRVDTTLGYARLYDGTVAADYYAAMALVEKRLALPEDPLAQPPVLGQLLALVDALRQGSLNPAQSGLLQQLRLGLMALAEQELPAEQVVKVLDLKE